MFVEVPAQQDHHQDGEEQGHPDQGQLQGVDAVGLGGGEEVDVSEETLSGAPHLDRNVQDVGIASALAAVLSAARLQPCGNLENLDIRTRQSLAISHMETAAIPSLWSPGRRSISLVSLCGR